MLARGRATKWHNFPPKRALFASGCYCRDAGVGGDARRRRNRDAGTCELEKNPLRVVHGRIDPLDDRPRRSGCSLQTGQDKPSGLSIWARQCSAAELPAERAAGRRIFFQLSTRSCANAGDGYSPVFRGEGFRAIGATVEPWLRNADNVGSPAISQKGLLCGLAHGVCVIDLHPWRRSKGPRRLPAHPESFQISAAHRWLQSLLPGGIDRRDDTERDRAARKLAPTGNNRGTLPWAHERPIASDCVSGQQSK